MYDATIIDCPKDLEISRLSSQLEVAQHQLHSKDEELSRISAQLEKLEEEKVKQASVGVVVDRHTLLQLSVQRLIEQRGLLRRLTVCCEDALTATTRKPDENWLCSISGELVGLLG
jgi:hypothetical protein